MAKNRNILGKLMQSKLFFVLLLIITMVSGFRLSSEISRRMSISNEVQELRAQTEKLQAQRDSLSQLVQSLGTDYYIEEELRKKLNRAEEGETLVIISDRSTGIGNTGSTSTTYPIPYLWWSYFFSDKS